MATAADLRNVPNSERFVDPFVTTSSQYIPQQFNDLLDMCRYLAAQFPSYTQTAKRTVSHFLTELQFYGEDGDADERKETEEYVVNTLKIMEALQQAGMEYFIMGNSFVRMYHPFDRYLVDSRDGHYAEYNVNQFGEDATFCLGEMAYEVPDPRQADLPVEARRKVKLAFRDRTCRAADRVKITFIDPKRMILRKNHVSGRMEYIWRIDEFFVEDVRQGQKIWQINDTPMSILKAIRDNEDYRFDEGSIFHMANTFLSGVSYNGWGIPGILLNYHSIHQTAVYRSINEHVGLDYLLPVRVLTPAPTGQGAGSDAATSMNLGPWTQSAQAMIRNKRKDPTAMHVFPFPLQYQELGGNGKALAPVELIRYANDQMLEDFGFPAELHHMSLQAGEVPTAIRMFQANFIQLQHLLSNLVQWVVSDVLSFMGRPNIKVKLAAPTMADDLERRHVMLQLAAGGEVSRQLAYRLFGVDDATEEIRRRTKEDLEIQRMQAKEQADFEREQTIGSGDQVLQSMVQAQQEAMAAQQAQQGGGGGAPPAPPAGGGGGVTPDKMLADADQLAQQWLQMQGQDDAAKNKSMEEVRNTNPTLYAVAKQRMEEIRAQGASQGRRMAGKQ